MAVALNRLSNWPITERQRRRRLHARYAALIAVTFGAGVCVEEIHAERALIDAVLEVEATGERVYMTVIDGELRVGAALRPICPEADTDRGKNEGGPGPRQGVAQYRL